MNRREFLVQAILGYGSISVPTPIPIVKYNIEIKTITYESKLLRYEKPYLSTTIANINQLFERSVVLDRNKGKVIRGAIVFLDESNSFQSPIRVDEYVFGEVFLKEKLDEYGNIGTCFCRIKQSSTKIVKWKLNHNIEIKNYVFKLYVQDRKPLCYKGMEERHHKMVLYNKNNGAITVYKYSLCIQKNDIWDKSLDVYENDLINLIS